MIITLDPDDASWKLQDVRYGYDPYSKSVKILLDIPQCRHELLPPIDDSRVGVRAGDPHVSTSTPTCLHVARLLNSGSLTINADVPPWLQCRPSLSDTWFADINGWNRCRFRTRLLSVWPFPLTRDALRPPTWLLKEIARQQWNGIPELWKRLLEEYMLASVANMHLFPTWSTPLLVLPRSADPTNAARSLEPPDVQHYEEKLMRQKVADNNGHKLQNHEPLEAATENSIDEVPDKSNGKLALRETSAAVLSRLQDDRQEQASFRLAIETQMALLVERIDHLTQQEIELQKVVRKTQERIRSSDEATRAIVEGIRRDFEYQFMVQRIQKVVSSQLPLDAKLLVISKGDDRLLVLGGRTAWHFPQNEQGTYPGHNPSDSLEILDQLESLRASGAQYLLIPNTAYWMLEAYEQFGQHLQVWYTRIWHDADAMLFQLFRPEESVRVETEAPVPRSMSLPCPPTWPASFPVAEVPPARPLEVHQASVDIIICVHNALADVKQCLESVIRSTRMPYSLILVDDGSDDETRKYLKHFAYGQQATLIRHERAKGYTLAANVGLRQSRAAYALLLNSDTTVGPNWLDRLVACGESDPAIGLVGPLSNTASWQSIPDVYTPEDWAENQLPAGMTVRAMASMVAHFSGRLYPRMPLLNGFCLLIKHKVLEDIGYFDEERFGKGYGEENDFCLRARQLGWQLALADDVYIYHRQSKSYCHERRRTLCAHADQALLAKHGAAIVQEGVEFCRRNRVLEGLRARAKVLTHRQDCIDEARRNWEGKRVLFLLPIKEPCGGGNVVVQLVRSMREMGVDAGILNFEEHRAQFEASYPDVAVPLIYVPDKTQIAPQFVHHDAVLATWNGSVEWLQTPCFIEHQPIRGYFIQDFEPLFFQPGEPDYQLAWDSYTLFGDLRRIATTMWIRNLVKVHQDVECTVVGPCVDIDLFQPRPRTDPNWPQRPLRIAAMVRPSTPRRGPYRTMEVLRDLSRAQGNTVEIIIFGCCSEDPRLRELPHDFPFRNAGVLTRLQVACLLNEIDVFVDFSEFQALGLTALEAMACGAATLLPQEGGSGSFAKDEENCLIVDTRSSAECFEALRRVVLDERLRSRLQRQAIHDACRFFPEKIAFNTLHALFGGTQEAQPSV